MNVITVAGNLGRDAELRHAPSGDAVCQFSVADNQGKDKEAIWWRCNLWGKRAEALSQYLTRGTSVTVSGSVSERKWTDKDGQERVSMEIRVAEVALQGSREGGGRNDDGRQRQTQTERRPTARGDDPFDSSDIPF